MLETFKLKIVMFPFKKSLLNNNQSRYIHNFIENFKGSLLLSLNIKKNENFLNRILTEI